MRPGEPQSSTGLDCPADPNISRPGSECKPSSRVGGERSAVISGCDQNVKGTAMRSLQQSYTLYLAALKGYGLMFWLCGPLVTGILILTEKGKIDSRWKQCFLTPTPR